MTATATVLGAVLTVEEAARALRVSHATIYRRIGDGSLRAFRTAGGSGPFRIRAEELRKFTSAGRGVTVAGVTGDAALYGKPVRPGPTTAAKEA